MLKHLRNLMSPLAFLLHFIVPSGSQTTYAIYPPRLRCGYACSNLSEGVHWFETFGASGLASDFGNPCNKVWLGRGWARSRRLNCLALHFGPFAQFEVVDRVGAPQPSLEKLSSIGSSDLPDRNLYPNRMAVRHELYCEMVR